MKVKISTNDFSEKYTIDSEESHKAYYLFNHPEKRGVFSNGVAISGTDLRGIKPDFNAIMGWNPSHILNDDDYNELKRKGKYNEAYLILQKATLVARLAEENPTLLQLPLSEAVQLLPMNESQNALSESVKKLEDHFNINDP